MKQTITIIAIIFATVTANAQSKVKFGGGVNYYKPTSTQKGNISPLLFTKSGQSVETEVLIASAKSKVGFRLGIAYFTGTNDKESPAIYAKENNISYSKYSFTKSKPSALTITMAPRISLFPKAKKLPLVWLDLNIGAALTNQQSLQFYSLQSNVPEKEIKTNSLSFIYNPTININMFKVNKAFVNLKVGYSNFGGFGVGIAITEQNCQGFPCRRSPPACPFCTPEPSKIIEN